MSPGVSFSASLDNARSRAGGTGIVVAAGPGSRSLASRKRARTSSAAPQYGRQRPDGGARRRRQAPRAARRRTSCGGLSNRPGPRMWYVARSPMLRCCCRCLVLLLLVAVVTGFPARPLEAATRPFADIVDAAARRHGVDPSLVHAIIAVESGYRATAQSPAGAQGLMQLMPGTQRQLGVSDAFDPQQNVDAGVAYLQRLTDEFGDRTGSCRVQRRARRRAALQRHPAVQGDARLRAGRSRPRPTRC